MSAFVRGMRCGFDDCLWDVLRDRFAVRLFEVFVVLLLLGAFSIDGWGSVLMCEWVLSFCSC